MSDVPVFLNELSREYHDSPWTDPQWPQFRLGIDPAGAVAAGRRRAAARLRRLADLLDP